MTSDHLAVQLRTCTLLIAPTLTMTSHWPMPRWRMQGCLRLRAAIDRFTQLSSSRLVYKRSQGHRVETFGDWSTLIGAQAINQQVSRCQPVLLSADTTAVPPMHQHPMSR